MLDKYRYRIGIISITFMQRSGIIFQDLATFLIPDKFFKKKLNQKEMEKRAEILLEQLELLPAGFSISFGDVEEYSWAAWEEKNVRKVTLNFGIGC